MGQNFSCLNSSSALPDPTIPDGPLEKSAQTLSIAPYIDQFRTDDPANPYNIELLKEVYGEFIGVYRATKVLQRQESDLEYSVDDRILVLREEEVDWAFATNLSIGPQSKKNEGFILLTQLIEDRDVPQAHEAWFDISREQAEALLLLPGFEQGTYLLRPCPVDEQAVMLSVRTRVYEDWQVRHFVIKCDENSEYFIKDDRKYATFSELLQDCASNEDSGVCCKLTNPCPHHDGHAYRIRQMYILHKDVRVLRRIDEAAASWYEARLMNDMQTIVSVHTFDKGAMRDDKFLMEVRSMRSLNHRNVVKLLAVVLRSDTQPHFVLFESVYNRTLLAYLRGDKTFKLPPATLLDFCVQVADGLAHLEQKRVVHGDVRAENMLFAEAHTVKIAGFGLAKYLPEAAENGARYVTKWSAPELAQTQQFTAKSDCWSFGVMMYEVATRGREPYENKSASDVQKFISNNNRLPQPKGPNDYCPPEVYKIMMDCWKATAAERPAFSKLLQDLRTLALVTELECQRAKA